MAFEEYDDYEQSERVQQWLRKNGVSILVGIVLGLVLIFGWQQWKGHRATHRAEAAEQYQALQQAIAAKNDKVAANIVTKLHDDYSGTAYAALGSSVMARYQADNGKLDQARTSLTWAHDHAENDVLKGLMALRLARVDLAAGKAQDALDTLQTLDKKDFAGLAEELRGDALVKLGRVDEARQAYQASLSALNEDAPQRGSVKVKLENLATAGKQGA
ncbi:tetratricopeptide repeat protein [Oleiagrimonas sp. C23AA]|uniref:YfgM family protein n=1 Tax=Oleiagrimonas sp. C23AA TaxID=2719047 RepID=UPI00142313A5|nr:tetratricopeptide repeat protein [Oleiagrimonas sp. C23AA]NII10941.1 tetratricopeptide repeat protein [Oleiagrimonas sp. C23AA]